MDRWYAEFALRIEIVAAGSSDVRRIRDISDLDEVGEERPVSEAGSDNWMLSVPAFSTSLPPLSRVGRPPGARPEDTRRPWRINLPPRRNLDR